MVAELVAELVAVADWDVVALVVPVTDADVDMLVVADLVTLVVAVLLAQLDTLMMPRFGKEDLQQSDEALLNFVHLQQLALEVVPPEEPPRVALGLPFSERVCSR